MVHHSRNSEQKRWDETVVIALGGMARLLRAHLPAIVGMARMAGALAALRCSGCCPPGLRALPRFQTHPHTTTALPLHHPPTLTEPRLRSPHTPEQRRGGL